MSGAVKTLTEHQHVSVSLLRLLPVPGVCDPRLCGGIDRAVLLALSWGETTLQYWFNGGCVARRPDGVEALRCGVVMQ
jgi:hypothetical protein